MPARVRRRWRGVTATDDGDGAETLTVNNAAGVTFTGAVGAMDTLTVGSVAANSSATFQSDVSAQAIAIGTNAAANIFTLTFANQSSDIVVGGAITANMNDMVTVHVVDATDGEGPQTTTFGGALSGVDVLNVGSTNGAQAGAGVFNGTVGAANIAANITVRGGNAGRETSSAEFNGAVTGAVAVTGGSNATADARVTFTKNLTGNVTLDDGNSGNDGALVTFSGTTGQTIDGTINAASGSANTNEGTVRVQNTAVANFTQAIGGTNAIRAIEVGSSTTQGIATFGSTVNAQTITVRGGDAAGETSSAEFSGAVTGAVTVAGGTNASADASVTFRANVTKHHSIRRQCGGCPRRLRWHGCPDGDGGYHGDTDEWQFGYGCGNSGGEQRRRSDVCGEHRCGGHVDGRQCGGQFECDVPGQCERASDRDWNQRGG